MRDLLRDLESYLSSKSDDHEDPAAEGLLLRLAATVPPNYEAARRCADWVMTAYTRAAPENGGDGTVSWDEIDYAHEAAREAFTDEEIEEFNNQAKEFNGCLD